MRYLVDFRNLERLVAGTLPLYIQSFHSTLLTFQRLTHLAITHFNVSEYDIIHSAFLPNLEGVVHTRLQRIVCGWKTLFAKDVVDPQYIKHFEGIRQRILASLSESGRAKVMISLYDTVGPPRREGAWFADRIMDGTIWEFEE
jgi:hypothetical protein